MIRKVFCLTILAFSIIVFSGCVRESTNGDTHKFGYELWVPGLILLAGLVATPAGWALRKSNGRWGWVLLIFGPIAVFGIAPSLFLDRMEVHPDGFSRHSGIWGMTAVQNVSFDNVDNMRVETREERGRRGRRVNRTYLICDLKSGDNIELPTGNEVAKEAIPQILKAADGKGIRIAIP